MNEKKRSGLLGLIVLMIIILGDLVSAFLGMASPVTPVIPVPTTFIVQSVGNGASYNAYLSTSSTIPFYTESNFTKIIHDDIEQGGQCPVGCTASLLQGLYNQTQTIVIDRNSFVITGPTAADILPQNIAFSGGPCGNHRPVFCIQAIGFTATGFKIDDIARDFVSGVTGIIFDNFGAPPGASSQQSFQYMTIWNASSNGFEFLSSSTFSVSFSNIFGPTPLPKLAGNHGISVGAGANGIRIVFNTIARFNGSDVAAISIVQGVGNVTIQGNDLFQNALGILVQKPLAVNILGNNVHNNFAAGIELTTLNNVFRGNVVTITGNTVTNNALTSKADPLCNNTVCSGIVLRSPFAGYDTVGITDNVVKDTQAVRTQQYDIDILGSQYTNLTIQGNTLGLSASGTTIHLAVTPVSSWRIESNNGYNPQPKRTITITTNPFTYTDNDAYLEQLQIDTVTGGLATVTCRGNALPTPVIGELSPNLNPGDTCVFTGTTTDTFDVLPT